MLIQDHNLIVHNFFQEIKLNALNLLKMYINCKHLQCFKYNKILNNTTSSLIDI